MWCHFFFGFSPKRHLVVSPLSDRTRRWFGQAARFDGLNVSIKHHHICSDKRPWLVMRRWVYIELDPAAAWLICTFANNCCIRAEIRCDNRHDERPSANGVLVYWYHIPGWILICGPTRSRIRSTWSCVSLLLEGASHSEIFYSAYGDLVRPTFDRYQGDLFSTPDWCRCPVIRTDFFLQRGSWRLCFLRLKSIA